MSILDAIMSRILSKSSSIYKVLELLEKIIKKCSNSIIPYHNKVWPYLLYPYIYHYTKMCNLIYIYLYIYLDFGMY